MKSGQASGENFGEPWRDTANYKPYLSYEKRRWAWLWLQRKPGHLPQGGRTANREWAFAPGGAHTLLRGQLNDLFGMGYSSMLSGGPTLVSTNGSFGLRISTRLSFRSRPNGYPDLLSVPLT
jgi:hypothetical protein